MFDLYECGHCGVVAEIDTQLCSPRPLSDKGDYCGTAPERGTMCEPMQQHLPFVCGSCGRPSEQAELVCNPLATG